MIRHWEAFPAWRWLPARTPALPVNGIIKSTFQHLMDLTQVFKQYDRSIFIATSVAREQWKYPRHDDYSRKEIWFQFLWIAFHVDQVFSSMFYLQKKWYWLSGKVLNENKLNFLGLLRIIEDAHITLRQTHREKGRVTITIMTEREVSKPPQTQEPKSSW